MVGERDAHDAIVLAVGKRQHFELHPLQFFQRQFFEQCAARRGEVMLHRIVEGEESAACFFETVAQCDQFLPTIDRDQPSVFEIAPELLGFNAEIDDVRVGPNKRMERLHVGDCRSVPFTSINLHRAGLAELDGNNSRRRVGAKKQRVFFQFHESSTDCADLRRLKA